MRRVPVKRDKTSKEFAISRYVLLGSEKAKDDNERRDKVRIITFFI
jgi:hypothetical protein